MSVRVAVAVFVAALVAFVVALFLGEYEFVGTMPWIAGPLVGLVLGELVLSIGRHRSVPLGLVVAALAGASLLRAGGIDANGVEPIKTLAYVAGALAAAAAYVRVGTWPRRTRPSTSNTRSIS